MLRGTYGPPCCLSSISGRLSRGEREGEEQTLPSEALSPARGSGTEAGLLLVQMGKLRPRRCGICLRLPGGPAPDQRSSKRLLAQRCPDAVFSPKVKHFAFTDETSESIARTADPRLPPPPTSPPASREWAPRPGSLTREWPAATEGQRSPRPPGSQSALGLSLKPRELFFLVRLGPVGVPLLPGGPGKVWARRGGQATS